MRSSAAWNQKLTELGAESPRFDAAQLPAVAFGAGTGLAHCHTARPLPRGLAVPAEDALARLRNGEPLQYLLGEWEFYGLTLAVGPVC